MNAHIPELIDFVKTRNAHLHEFKFKNLIMACDRMFLDIAKELPTQKGEIAMKRQDVLFAAACFLFSWKLHAFDEDVRACFPRRKIPFVLTVFAITAALGFPFQISELRLAEQRVFHIIFQTQYVDDILMDTSSDGDDTELKSSEKEKQVTKSDVKAVECRQKRQNTALLHVTPRIHATRRTMATTTTTAKVTTTMAGAMYHCNV